MGRNSHALEKSDCGRIERSGKAIQAEAVSEVLQLRLPFPWRERFLVEIVQRLTFPKGSFNLKEFIPAVDRQSVGSVGLELNRVCACFLGGTDDLGGLVEIVPMVARHFGDNVDRTTRSNGSAADLDRLWFHGARRE